MLVRTVDERRKNASALLQSARQTLPGQAFTAAGQTLTRSITKTAGKIWADDPATGKRRDLGHEDDHAFWAWADTRPSQPRRSSSENAGQSRTRRRPQRDRLPHP